MDRRRFLGSLAALGAVACTGAEPEVTPGSPDPAGDGTSGPTVTSTAPTTEALPRVDPLDAPPVGLDPGAFALGVASGDPDHRSVALWTRLVGSGLPEAFGVVWEVAADEDFDHLVATGSTDAAIGFAHSVHVVADGLPAETPFWYRFRAGDEVSSVGRTRTLSAPGRTPASFRIGTTSCQLRDAGAWAVHRDIAAADIDLVVFLGDFIYSRSSGTPLPGREHRSPDPSNLAGYRARYAEYRSDPLLQAAAAAHPWLITWDDHEVLNDYDASVDATRRLAAYQAWWEHQPTRLPAPGSEGFDIYRSIDAGDLVRVIVTDCRQYADGDTLLGEAQKSWLAEQLATTPGWTVLGSSVLVSGILVPFDDEVLLPYTWDGYPAERAWLADQLGRRPRRLCVSGDLHLGAVLEVSVDPADRTAPKVATEFMAPAVSSGFPEEYADVLPLVPLANLHIHHLDPANGWLRLDISATETLAEFRTVADVTNPESVVSASASFRVGADDPRPQALG